MRRVLAGLVFLAAWPGAGVAQAAPDCPEGLTTPRTLLSGQGFLESVIVENGRLFFSKDDTIARLDQPNGAPTHLTNITAPGGLAFDTDGKLVVGSGNSSQNGSVGDLTGPSSLIKVDPDTGAQQPYATGLSMGNGLVRGPDGAFYASNDFGRNIDRVLGGVTERGWSHVQSGNGLATDGTYLYVAQTFQPPAIQRIELAHPENVTFYAQDFEQLTAGLDGMTRDAAGRLFVTANGAGEVWRVDTNGKFCVVLRGLPGFPDGPSAVAIGNPGTPFPVENLYVVTFNGNVYELPGVAAPAASIPASPGANPGPPSAGANPAKKKHKKKKRKKRKRKRRGRR